MVSDFFKKIIFRSAYTFYQPGFLKMYRELKQNEKIPYDELEKKQTKQLSIILNYCYENVPYYNRLFKSLNIKPSDIKCINDLRRIPKINKDIIKQNWDQFIPQNIHQLKYVQRSTGGTTGTPLIYRLSKYDRFLSMALIYRGWSWGDYTLGDKVAILGGSSLIPDKSTFTSFLKAYTLNYLQLSSFDMEEKKFKEYLSKINRKKPRYIYGYASSIYFFAEWLEKSNLKAPTPSAIFTTSEKLYDFMRKKIEEVFETSILDGYGLSDGGVQAFQCSEKNGYHIATERSILEVRNEKGKAIEEGEGNVYATSLFNYALPFINYECGDIVKNTKKKCSCGMDTKILEEITGRTVDILITPDNKPIHGWFVLYLFWQYGNRIKKYQFIQEDLKNITINIVLDDNKYLNEVEKNLERVKELIWKRSPKWNIKINYTDKIEETISGKHKFIINKLKK